MVELASIPWLEGIPFWVILLVGVAFVGVDVLLTNDNHLMWIGAGILATGVANAAGLSGEIQILVFVGTLLACMLYVRRLISRIPRVEDQASEAFELYDLVGTVLSSDQTGTGEGRVLIPEHGEWRVKDPLLQLSPGDRARVVGREGLLLLVEKIP